MINAPSMIGAVADSPAPRAPRLSVIVPTFNERDNVVPLFRKIEAALGDIAFEVIFVDDDSPDGTADAVREVGRGDRRARCIRRIGRRGLAGACIEGMLAAGAPIVAVIDADMQHDETKLPDMLTAIESGEADLAVGSRYIEGGSADAFAGHRLGISLVATRVAQRLLAIKLSDPMSGFFMIRRDRFELLAPKLSTQGFKILLDIVATARGKLRTVEMPYRFGARQHGASKLDSLVALDFLGLLVAKLSRDTVSLRFVLFAAVGALGLLVHLAMLFVAHELLDWPFAESQAIAALTAMTSNFLLNNHLTYRDQRLRGGALLVGLIKFYAVCSVGLLANVGVAFSVYDSEPIWWLAGVAGALMGVVWNYGMSSVLVWRRA